MDAVLPLQVLCIRTPYVLLPGHSKHILGTRIGHQLGDDVEVDIPGVFGVYFKMSQHLVQLSKLKVHLIDGTTHESTAQVQKGLVILVDRTRSLPVNILGQAKLGGPDTRVDEVRVLGT